MDDRRLSPVTIIVEWENAIDVEDEWTARAMAALERELGAERRDMAEAPRILYLYDRNKVAAGTVEGITTLTAGAAVKEWASCRNVTVPSTNPPSKRANG